MHCCAENPLASPPLARQATSEISAQKQGITLEIPILYVKWEGCGFTELARQSLSPLTADDIGEEQSGHLFAC